MSGLKLFSNWYFVLQWCHEIKWGCFPSFYTKFRWLFQQLVDRMCPRHQKYTSTVHSTIFFLRTCEALPCWSNNFKICENFQNFVSSSKPHRRKGLYTFCQGLMKYIHSRSALNWRNVSINRAFPSMQCLKSRLRIWQKYWGFFTHAAHENGLNRPRIRLQ